MCMPKTIPDSPMRIARKKANLSQEDLAELVGLDQPQISRIEKEGFISTTRLGHLCKVVGHGLTLESVCFPFGLPKLPKKMRRNKNKAGATR